MPTDTLIQDRERKAPPVTAEWRDRSRLVFSPVAAPSALGLFAFMAGALTIGGYAANWFGRGTDAQYIAPFVLVLGLAQFLAGMWAYKSRDTWGTAFHGVWGAVFAAFGLAQIINPAALLLRAPVVTDSFAFTFALAALIMGSLTLIALFDSPALSLISLLAAAGSAVLAGGLWGGPSDLNTAEAGGVLLAISGALAWLAATAVTFSVATGRRLMPALSVCLGRWCTSTGSLSPADRRDQDSAPHGNGNTPSTDGRPRWPHRRASETA